MDRANGTASRRERLVDTFWTRHENPKSGWSRTLLGPLFVCACYRRSWRLAALAVAATVLNPIAFPPPDPTSESKSWMTRGVRAERWWLERGHGVVNRSWPNLLNAVSIPISVYTLVAAFRQQPIRAAGGLACSMALKFAWIELIARRHEAALEA